MSSRVISAVLTLRDRDFSSNLRRASGGVDDFQRQLQYSRNQIDRFASSAVSGFATVAKGAAGLAAAGLAGLGAAVAATVVEMDSAFDRLEAKTGATGSELEELKGVATNVFNGSFGESLTQVTDDVAVLNSMFGELSDSGLQSLAEGAYTISDLWGAEVSEVGTVVKNMTGNFKDLSEQDALDLLTTGFQKTGDYSGDLLDTMKEYSPLFSKLGLDAEDSMGILIKGAEAGAWNMDKVGDAVKEFGIRGMDGSKASAEGFALVGLNAEEMTKNIAAGGDSAKNAFAATLAGLASMEDPVAQNQAGVALFGTQWEDVRADVILAMTDGASAVEGFQGATEEAAASAYDNFGSKMLSVWRELKMGIADAFNDSGGTALLDGIAAKADELVPKVQSLITEAVEFATEIHDNWGTIEKVITPIASAIGAVYLQLGAVWVWNAAKKAMDLYKASAFATTWAQHGLNAAMKANPIGLVITAVTILVGAGVALYQNWDTVRTKTGELWDKLGAFQGVATIVLGPLGQIVRTAVTMAENWDNTRSVWGNVWNGIALSASNSVNNVIGSINSLIKHINKIPGVNIPIVAKVDWGQTKAPQGVANFRKLDSYDVGTNRVSRDMVAQIHKDEMIIPARQSQRLRQQGVTIDNIDQIPSNRNNQPSNNSQIGGPTVIIEKLIATGITVAEVVNELVPQLKLELANM